MPVISKKGIGHEREDKTMAMTAVIYPELPGEGRELEIPDNREDMFRFLCRIDDYEKWMMEELEELRAWKFKPGDCIPDNVLLSKLDQIGGGGNRGFSNPVYTAYIASIEDAKERNERIEKVRVGDPVELVREPDNQYDFNAILVRNSDGSLGYISAEDNSFIAPLLDSGEFTCEAEVTTVIPLSKRSEKCRASILKISFQLIRK